MCEVPKNPSSVWKAIKFVTGKAPHAKTYNRIQAEDLNSYFGNLVSSPKHTHGLLIPHTLFLVFINDLPDTLQTQASIFADDTTIYSSGTNRKITSDRLTKAVILVPIVYPAGCQLKRLATAMCSILK